jgi:hypothetical protein
MWRESPVPRRRFPLGLTVALIALLVYGNTLRNGWAWDDVPIVENSPAVQAGDLGAALTTGYWPDAFTIGRGKLWRPLTTAAFTAQWSVFGNRPSAFHAVNAGVHALVSVLLFALLSGWVGAGPAFAGAALFAVHPVHAEAVANVVGLSELGAAAAYLVGCLLFRRLAGTRSSLPRVALTGGIAVCYVVALGFKEMGVTLPAALALLAWFDSRDRERPLTVRLWAEAPLFALLAGILMAYLAFRVWVLGGVLGDAPAPELAGLTTGERLTTAVSLWTEYLRLLVLPVDLSADYGPAVLFPARSFDALAAAGSLVLAGCIAGVVALRKRVPPVALGLAWFLVTILPVSHLLFPAGTILGERTLYLPSIGLALAAAGVAARLGTGRLEFRRIGVGAFTGVLLVFGMRTWARNPDWRDTEAVVSALERDHPESHVVVWWRARGAMAEGDREAALTGFDLAAQLRPTDFLVLSEASLFYEVVARRDRAEEILRQATRATPTNPHGWAMLARLRMKDADTHGARRVALEGLAASEMWLPALWEIVADSYRAEGRLVDAERAGAMAQRGGGLYPQAR